MGVANVGCPVGHILLHMANRSAGVRLGHALVVNCLCIAPSPTPDWIIDGHDLLIAIRTAWGGAASFHDNNWLTFKRVPNYCRLLPAAPAVAAAA